MRSEIMQKIFLKNSINILLCVVQSNILLSSRSTVTSQLLELSQLTSLLITLSKLIIPLTAQVPVICSLIMLNNTTSQHAKVVKDP